MTLFPPDSFTKIKIGNFNVAAFLILFTSEISRPTVSVSG